MEAIKVCCYNCGSLHNTPYASENGYSLVKCSDCGLLYVNPRPSDESIASDNEYGVHPGDTKLDTTWVFNEQKIPFYLKVLGDVYGKELKQDNRTWLDIGCGHGEFLIALQQSSHHQIVAKGLEPNKFKQESARSRGLEVSYFDLFNHTDRYDVISLLNVYSHLPDPPGFFYNCRKLLNPGGELLIETGDTADLPSELHHRPFQLPDHLSFASDKIVSDILKRNGFRIVAKRKYPSFPFKRSIFRWLKEAAKYVWPGKRSLLPDLIKHHKRSREYARDMFIRAKWTGK